MNVPMLLSFLVLLEVATASASAGAAACENPAPDDARPYTLCVAETDFEQATVELERQWTISIARVRALKGARAARLLRDEQRQWMRRRDRDCEKLAGASPTTQAGRNQMACLAIWTEKRTAQLRTLAKPR